MNKPKQKEVYLHHQSYYNYLPPFLLSPHTASPLPRDCREVYTRGERRSGVYLIDPGCPAVGAFNISCDMDTVGGPWMVIQRRMDGSVQFGYRNWVHYAAGFGHLEAEHWLGLDKMHRSRVLEDTPSVRGMVSKIGHLVEIVEE